MLNTGDACSRYTLVRLDGIEQGPLAKVHSNPR